MKTFLNDKDGVSEKDYLLLVSTTVFFLFVAVGLVLVLMGRTLDAMYVTLLDMVAPVLMTITGGVFGVRAVQEYRRHTPSSDEPRREEEDNRGTTSPI
jgi:positive regulator of sigma E activity